MQGTEFTLSERDEAGKETAVYVFNRNGKKLPTNIVHSTPLQYVSVTRLLRGIFLPVGFPNSVSDDYLRYQILNACQAFCSSLAGLLASRAVLEGHGVGNADASATDALLLTILQDIYSRLCTIISAYYLGTSLYPEAKTYRLLADILNDIALVLDSLSPHLSTLTFNLLRSPNFPFISLSLAHRPGPLRAIALCLSGVFRAICGVVAGGSKAALTLHFAQPVNDKERGDVGDLSAKDGSKETVLALFGMLCGSALMPYVTDAWTTYTLLATLLVAHILLNYAAVRGVVLRSLNRQRAGLLWSAYRRDPSNLLLLTPSSIAQKERIFSEPSELYDSSRLPERREVTGYCQVGAPLSSILLGTQSWFKFGPNDPAKWTDNLTSAQILTLLDTFSSENFIVWLSRDIHPKSNPLLHIILKEGHTSSDHLKAWTLATEFSSRIAHSPLKIGTHRHRFDDLLETLQSAKETVDELYPGFCEAIKKEGWDLGAAAGGFVTGLPTTVSIQSGVGEDKKSA
ncbi:vitamin B6 photo-protection and homoeostasis-domain-containing protein [Irpex rosettiformis]|uniref:Vitamin B6 photo-protection and homoeostasis-domain-containing protein n=1 Tax=Irpex rosettiformis TaxID=378272 RepID=A0ACB8U435_9APHY|nr:vitamin B6 photo-protection and homoeostasis-domain-containing protein [Irpex rosettiformis]